jgi:hypothetical protein
MGSADVAKSKRMVDALQLLTLSVHGRSKALTSGRPLRLSFITALVGPSGPCIVPLLLVAAVPCHATDRRRSRRSRRHPHRYYRKHGRRDCTNRRRVLRTLAGAAVDSWRDHSWWWAATGLRPTRANKNDENQSVEKPFLVGVARWSGATRPMVEKRVARQKNGLPFLLRSTISSGREDHHYRRTRSAVVLVWCAGGGTPRHWPPRAVCRDRGEEKDSFFWMPASVAAP